MDLTAESLEDGEISPDFDQEQQQDQEEEVQQAEQPQQQQQHQKEECSPEHQVQHDEPQQLRQLQQQNLQQQVQEVQQQQQEQEQEQEQEQHSTTAAAAEPEEAPSIDTRLDFTSADFDAELALQTDGLQLPVSDAPLLDNISRCAGMLQPVHDQQKQHQHQQQQHQGRLQGASSAQEAEAKKAKAAAFKQRALQAAQRAEASVKLGSLTTIMSAAAAGPLAVLGKWHAAQQRIYVVTRHASGVRGRAVGTLVGFDKYLNLLLKDVEETYTVIVKVQRVKQQVVQQQQQQGGAEGQQQEQQAPAVRTRTRWCRKQQHRHRQLDQILLKGDNIVLVSGTPPQLQLPARAPP